MIVPVRLTNTYPIKNFDCSDLDLNEFLFKDALSHNNSLLAVTYLVESNDKLDGFFCLFNDNINVNDIDDSKKFTKVFPYKKRKYKTYPAVKIGRLGINKCVQGNGLGTKILDFIKLWFVNNNKTGCRFITVDAYNNDKSLNFYKKNEFKFFTEKDNRAKTRSMYYDLIEVADIQINSSSGLQNE